MPARHQQQRRCSARSTGPRTTAATCRCPTTSTTRTTRTRRSTSPTYGTSANGTEGPSKINLLNANLFTLALVDEAERVPHHAVARVAAARGDLVQHPRGHRHRVRALVPVRQPVLHGAQRRRADEALPGEGQRHHRPRRPHDQGRRRVAAHEQRPGVPRLLRGPLPVRQRHRVPAVHLARGARRVRAEHDRLLERRVRHGAGQLSRRDDDDAAGRCCSICRAAARTASRATRPARRTSATRNSRCSCRTSGRPATA